MPPEKLFGFSARDIQRIQKAVRFIEDNATTFRTYRRIRGAQGGGGTSLTLATVIDSVLYSDAARASADGPVEGFGEYVLRLSTDATPTWATETLFLAGQSCIGSDGFKYTSKSGTVGSENTGHNPVISALEGVRPDDREAAASQTNYYESDYWSVARGINPQHLEFGAVTDWRWFVPFHGKTGQVELISSGGVYYFAAQMTRVRQLETGSQSIMWSENLQRLKAVYA